MLPISNLHSKGRLLCLTSNFPRWQGDSTTPFVLNLAKDLLSLGWRVDVLAPHAPGCARQEVLDGVKVERFRYLWPPSIQTVCYQGGALINLRQNKTNFLKLPALVAAEWAALLRRLLTRRYDLLHSHWLLPQGFVGVLAAKLTRVPHVITIHGGDVFGLQQKMLAPFKRFALKQADAVTVNSSVTEQAVKDLVPALTTVQRIPMGVDLPDITRDEARVRDIRERYGVGAGPLLVFVGRVVEEKGIEDLIRAVPRIAEHCPDVRALIIGEGQDRSELEHLSRELGLSDRITFTGWVDSREVPAFLAAADAFVGPSRRSRDGWIEAQGLAFLEAMAVGTPVVATRSGGIVDSVIHEETGLLVDEHSPGQIAEAVIRLHTEDSLSLTLREHGRSQVETTFSRDASTAKFSDVFDLLLDARGVDVSVPEVQR